MSAELNKQVVQRFNTEVIENGSLEAWQALMAPDFVNRSAPSGQPDGAQGMWDMFQHVLRPAFSELRVEIHDQVADGDKVTTRKTITGHHTGPLMGIAATGARVAIDVIDIVRVRDGQYVEHWGVNTLPTVMDQLKQG